MIWKRENINKKKRKSLLGLSQRFLTFLMFLCFLGGDKDSLFSNKRNRRKSPSPHRRARMVSVTQGAKPELNQVAITLFRKER